MLYEFRALMSLQCLQCKPSTGVKMANYKVLLRNCYIILANHLDIFIAYLSLRLRLMTPSSKFKCF